MATHDWHEAKRASWNRATEAHNSHKRDQAAFLRAGGGTLYPTELELLGNVRGKALVHLQCNSGQDTLSLARLGAVVTGVDISDTAITFARTLAADTGIAATFERADIYEWLDTTPDLFDVAFSSYGALVWLSDLKAWARGIARVLKPGGRFVIVDFHQMLMMFSEKWQLTYDYMGGTHLTFDGVGDYVALTGEALAPSGYETGVVDFVNPHPAHEFCWGVADIVTALLDAGLRLETLREYPYTNGFKPFEDMRELPDGRFAMPEGMPQLAMMYGISVEKPLSP